MRLHGSGGVAEGMKTSRALVGVGRAVEGECRATWGKKQKKEKAEAKTAGETTREVVAEAEEEGEVKPRRKRAKKAEEAIAAELEAATSEGVAGDGVPGAGSMPEWSQLMRVRVGSFLVDRLMESAVVTRQGVDSEGNTW